VSCFIFVFYEKEKHKGIDACSHMQRQNWNQSFNSIWKIKPQSTKVNLFIKSKAKTKRWFPKNWRNKKKVQKVQKFSSSSNPPIYTKHNTILN
jgi:hypothetical protein